MSWPILRMVWKFKKKLCHSLLVKLLATTFNLKQFFVMVDYESKYVKSWRTMVANSKNYFIKKRVSLHLI